MLDVFGTDVSRLPEHSAVDSGMSNFTLYIFAYNQLRNYGRRDF
jgi:hypothetical protein